MKQSLPVEEQPEPSYWIVTCPEPKIRGGVWRRWYRENCVAVGWYPPTWSFDAQGEDTEGWPFARNRLKRMRAGDKVIPFLLKSRIGPVGTIRAINATDVDWNPTVEKGNYRGNEGHAALGRRILVTWEQAGMPPDGKIATVPVTHRRNGRSPLARHTIEELSDEQFLNFCSVLSAKENWGEVATVPGSVENDNETSSAEKELLNEAKRIANRLYARVVISGTTVKHTAPNRTAPENVVINVRELLRVKPLVCYLCGGLMQIKAQNRLLQPSPDRIDSSIGDYGPENMKLAHLACNLGKNASSVAEFQQWLEVLKHI